ncbi:unnamed protein product, partial [Brenthis ino]
MEKHKQPTYKYCIVPECKNTIRNAPDKVFFLVPRGIEIRRQWCKIIKRDRISPSTPLYCCEDHFNVEEDTDNYIQYKIMTQIKQKVILRLKKGILPHKFQCQNDTELQPPPKRKGSLKRKHQEIIEEASSTPHANESDNVLIITKSSLNNHLEADSSSSCYIQTIEDNETKNICEPGCSPSFYNVYDKKISITQPSVSSSSFESEMSSDLSCIEGDSDKDTQFKKEMHRCMLIAIEKNPKMLIGLPKRSYYLIRLLSENIPLPTADILITLKKLKLNESFSILALQFGYTQSKISEIFFKSIPLLSEKMKELIVWPTPTEISKNLPSPFRARCSNVVSIIDCLEIQIEKPTNAVNQSQYEKCNTMKYLISCTPDGLVNFVSVGYSGEATDIMLIEESGFLERLPPNTAVLVDRGFNGISHLLQKKDCTVKRLPSKSIGVKNVNLLKRIASLRLHIERILERLRQFHMLLPHACIDHDLVPVIDDVILVACGLINTQYILLKK